MAHGAAIWTDSLKSYHWLKNRGPYQAVNQCTGELMYEEAAGAVASASAVEGFPERFKRWAKRVSLSNVTRNCCSMYVGEF